MEAEMELTSRSQRGMWTRPEGPGPRSRERPGDPAAPEQSVTVEVRQEAPFLPKVAFSLITMASLAGALFTGQHLGMSGLAGLFRWLNLWALGLSTGFLAWRVFYVREREPDVRPESVRALNATALEKAEEAARLLGLLLATASVGLWWPSFLWQRGAAGPLVVGHLLLALALAWGVAGWARRWVPALAWGLAILLTATWAWTDTLRLGPALVRLLHLTAFGLWVGGALWNLTVAIPAGIRHPDMGAVVVGARQLERFRWVVRAALPTIIITGLLQAWPYQRAAAAAQTALAWWSSLPGALIPLKLLLIGALVVIFITCPLYHQCSPVKGVCNLNDLTVRRIHRLDNRRTPCALGLIRAQTEMAALAPGDVLEILSKDRFAPYEVPAWADKEGHVLLSTSRVGWWVLGYYRFLVQKAR